MPNAGQTTDTAVICQWKVKIGDNVKRGDILLEAETDKAVLPVESFATGIVIDILAGEGDTVEGGDIVCVIGDAKDQDAYTKSNNTEAVPPEQQEVMDSSEPDGDFIPIMKTHPEAPTVEVARGQYPAMPNSKRMAKELGVDLQMITPSNGAYITRHDVISYTDSHVGPANDYEVMPMSRMRKAIARRMVESVSTVPTFQVTVSVDMLQAINLKKQMEELKNVKISYNDIIIKALSVVAKEYSLINARYEQEELRMYSHTNIGLAVAIDEGLVVPVIEHADMLSLFEIAKASRALIEKARKGTLTTDEMGCGSISISNLGMFGVDHFTAIVNPPESAILAVGGIVTKPVWEGDGWKPVEMMKITGSFDHRIIDGAYAARLLDALRTLIEHPLMMFV
ncbi:MAG: 2-oxo acid dehydrogenase subunit E2 [Spirochaetales bacterium]|nr:2-oxo acid dehydrogenase subunit E2 [Spirochaetales bacterium]